MKTYYIYIYISEINTSLTNKEVVEGRGLLVDNNILLWKGSSSNDPTQYYELNIGKLLN